jgi:hypothetical protein
LLQPAPETLKIQLGQFRRHRSLEHIRWVVFTRGLSRWE